MPRPLADRLKAEIVIAPVVLNTLMAKFAEAAGFSTGFLGGGTLGYLNGCTEANLSLTKLVHAGLETMLEVERQTVGV